jgi:pimeloyl-ACP methyl ester carboxylesterase
VSEIRTGSVEANGLRFAYREAGSGPLVLCIHGFPDTAHTFDDLLPRLAAAGFRAVAPFTRGYPPTSLASDGDYSMMTLGQDVLALIAALGVESALVVGHDWGALASYLAANLEPRRVRKLVTVAIPHARVVRPTLPMLRGLSHFFLFQLPFIARWVRRRDFAFLDRLVRKWSPRWNPSAEEMAPVKHAFSQPGALEAALSYYRAFVRQALGRRWREARRILRADTTVPTLTFAGLADGALPADEFDAARAAFTGPYELVKVPDAGHFLHREQPQLFAERLLRFLQS